MAFKVLIIVRAPDSNPEKDISFLKNDNIEVTTVAFDLNDTEGIIDTCIRHQDENGLQALILCPAVSNELVAKITEKIGDKTAIFVGRGDFQSVHLASQYTSKEWFNTSIPN
ncbi:MAG: DUF6506 family protein [Bacteroidetes bacterium]|nr:DUF6506 family protein [Bacteroidota bacterium]